MTIFRIAAYFAILGLGVMQGCGDSKAQPNPGRTAGDAYTAAQHIASTNCDAAIPLFRIAIRRDPSFSLAFAALGDCAVKIGDYRAAKDAYAAALSLSPGDYQLYYKRGIVEGLQGNSSRSINDERIALQKAPPAGTAYAPIGDAFAKQNDFVDALRAANSALALQKKSEYYVARGSYYQMAGKLKLAESDYATAISVAVTPDARAAALVTSAGLHQNMEQFARAEAEMKRALNLAPQNAGYYDVAAGIYTRAGNLSAAQQVYATAVQRIVNPNKLAQAFISLGNTYSQSEKIREAQRAYDEALKRATEATTMVQVRLARGDLDAKSGKKRDALDEYRQAVRISDDPSVSQTVDARVAALPADTPGR